MTRGTPDSITALTHHILDTVAPNEVVETLEFMREVGMSCMVMNGVRHARPEERGVGRLMRMPDPTHAQDAHGVLRFAPTRYKKLA